MSVSGSIDRLGDSYVVGLKAVNCITGDVLAQAQEQAAGKEMVLKALDKASISAAQPGRITRVGEEIRHPSGTSDHSLLGSAQGL